MKRLAIRIATVALTALAAGAQGASDDEVLQPGAPAGMSGFAGFLAVSRIEFEGSDDDPHELEVVYLFPDRARWSIRSLRGGAADRSLFYRFGNQAWAVDPGTGQSRAFERPDRLSTLLQMELRRAAMFYPVGFDWSDGEDASTRVATVQETTSVAPHSESEEAAHTSATIGTLVAALDAEGRPVRIDARLPSGEGLEALAIDAWQTIGKRDWPARMTLLQDTTRVWTESIERVVTRIHSVDRFFQPVDRRAGAKSTFVDGRVIHSIDLSPITYRAYAIDLEPEPFDWAPHLARAADWIAAAREALGPDGPAVDLVPSFELSAEGRPTRCLVRLAQARTTPPAGWTTRSDVPGVALVLEGMEELSRDALALLRRAAPAGERAGIAYCRVVRAEGPEGVQLYLPLVAGE